MLHQVNRGGQRFDPDLEGAYTLLVRGATSLAKRLSVVAPEFRVHVNHHQKDTIPGYTAELGYQVSQLRAECAALRIGQTNASQLQEGCRFLAACERQPLARRDAHHHVILRLAELGCDDPGRSRQKL